jgi:hypothetical protein
MGRGVPKSQKEWTTHTASAAPALTIPDCEKYLWFWLSPALPINLGLDAFKQSRFGLDAKPRTEPMRASARVTALATLCALMIADAIDRVERFSSFRDWNFFLQKFGTWVPGIKGHVRP